MLMLVSPAGESMFRVVGLLAVLLLTGCGASTGTVQGTVTYQNQPVENGEVRFEPVNGRGSVEGGAITNGKFMVANLLPGKYKVTVEAILSQPKMTQAGGPESKRTLTAAEKAAQADALPRDTLGKEQEFEVRTGEQKMTFSLTSPSAGS